MNSSNVTSEEPLPPSEEEVSVPNSSIAKSEKSSLVKDEGTSLDTEVREDPEKGKSTVPITHDDAMPVGPSFFIKHHESTNISAKRTEVTAGSLSSV